MRKVKIIGYPQKPVRLKNLKEGEYGYISERDIIIDKPRGTYYKNCAINSMAFVYSKSDSDCYIPVYATKDGLEIDLSEIVLYKFTSLKTIQSKNGLDWIRFYVPMDLFGENKSTNEEKEMSISSLHLMSLKALNLFLEELIKKEAYESAAKCRDEIMKREKSKQDMLK